MSALSYDLLLDLYRGKASVVEQLTAEQRSSLRVDTPLTRYIEEAGRQGSPKHIFLTGNAGDGKTFASLAADASGFHIVRDASASEDRGPLTPIEHLASHLAEALAAGRRLLVAINRGQMERLEEFSRRPGAVEGPLAALIASVRKQSRLREDWPTSEPRPEVALIDLGLLDTISPAILKPMLDKICSSEQHGLSLESQKAFTAALEALRTEQVRGWLYRCLRAARARGHHATMRQLWSLLAFLATGRRATDSLGPVSIEDAVGARLFSERAESPLVELARETLDPAMTPAPALARDVLLGRVHAQFQGLPGLAGLTVGSEKPSESGAALIRAATVHGHPLIKPMPLTEDVFDLAVQSLSKQKPGWHAINSITRRLLQGIYRALRLWSVGASFPAWQTLCFDSSHLSKAAAVATEEIDSLSLRLALPRPTPECQRALEGAWRPPYLWLSIERQGVRPEGSALRLTPRLFGALYTAEEDAADELTASEALTIQRWLSRLKGSRPAEGVRVGNHETRPLLLTQDPFAPEKTLVTWEGSDGAN